nr:CoA-binding protein [Xanthomonadales bacterium]
MRPAQHKNFLRLLNPRHIAFIGGRDAITAIGEARRRGYQGQMWGVNPSRADLDGVPCFATIDDLPEAPDAAYIAIPATAAVQALAELAQSGAGGAVCYAAGFKEAGPEGEAAEARLRRVVGDMALIGPNCYGLINYLGSSALWSF